MHPENEEHLRMSLARKREILWAVAWRGLLYSVMAMVGIACLTYLLSETAWRFFLNDSFRMNREQTAYLYLCLVLPSIMLGWLLAVGRVLHLRFSHFKITLLAQPRQDSWLRRLLSKRRSANRRRF